MHLSLMSSSRPSSPTCGAGFSAKESECFAAELRKSSERRVGLSSSPSFLFFPFVLSLGVFRLSYISLRPLHYIYPFSLREREVGRQVRSVVLNLSLSSSDLRPPASTTCPAAQRLSHMRELVRAMCGAAMGMSFDRQYTKETGKKQMLSR